MNFRFPLQSAALFWRSLWRSRGRAAKALLAIGLTLVLVLAQADNAWAARSGGRMGGGSFRRAPAPSRSVPRGGGYGGGYGGGFGFPFVIPFFGFGGGGLFAVLIGFALLNFLVNAFRQASESSNQGYGQASNPMVSVARVQVGLLAEARELQSDLNRIARTANTGTPAGRLQLLQETTLSLLRHPHFWSYGGVESDRARLEAAEAAFNQLSLAERSKFSEETLSNYNSDLQQRSAEPAKGAIQVAEQGPSEYIVVSLLVAAEGKLDLPQSVNESDDLRRALSRLGSLSSEQLLAVEILWTPQAEGDSLSADDIMTHYPDLRLV